MLIGFETRDVGESSRRGSIPLASSATSPSIPIGRGTRLKNWSVSVRIRGGAREGSELVQRLGLSPVVMWVRIPPFARAVGGTGRRVGLRNRCLRASEFESLAAHLPDWCNGSAVGLHPTSERSIRSLGTLPWYASGEAGGLSTR